MGGDLRRRFGQLLTAHRRRAGLTQEALAEAADLSVNMISRIEVGASGARFPVIERLAEVLKVDPAEFFSTEVPGGARQRKMLVDLSSRLATLSDDDLAWASTVLDAALRPRAGASAGSQPGARASATVRRASKKRS